MITGITRWDPKDLKDFILSCRADEGYPMFKTTFHKEHVWGKNNVLAVCWGGHNRVNSIIFTDVPKEDLDLIEKNVGDWKILLKKYGTEEDILKAHSYGLYIPAGKFPRIP